MPNLDNNKYKSQLNKLSSAFYELEESIEEAIPSILSSGMPHISNARKVRLDNISIFLSVLPWFNIDLLHKFYLNIFEYYPFEDITDTNISDNKYLIYYKNRAITCADILHSPKVRKVGFNSYVIDEKSKLELNQLFIELCKKIDERNQSVRKLSTLYKAYELFIHKKIEANELEEKFEEKTPKRGMLILDRIAYFMRSYAKNCFDKIPSHTFYEALLIEAEIILNPEKAVQNILNKINENNSVLDKQKTVQYILDVVQYTGESITGKLQDLENFLKEYQKWLEENKIPKEWLERYKAKSIVQEGNLKIRLPEKIVEQLEIKTGIPYEENKLPDSILSLIESLADADLNKIRMAILDTKVIENRQLLYGENINAENLLKIVFHKALKNDTVEKLFNSLYYEFEKDVEWNYYLKRFKTENLLDIDFSFTLILEKNLRRILGELYPTKNKIEEISNRIGIKVRDCRVNFYKKTEEKWGEVLHKINLNNRLDKFTDELKKTHFTNKKLKKLLGIDIQHKKVNQLHALLIAINNYHPKSRVRGLAGCINDRNEVKYFLDKYYTHLAPRLITLTDAEATRTNIISTFREQITKKARRGDTVLLYFAGLGSYATSAPVFTKFAGHGQDETLVCYDSRLPNNYDLTDKELAVLLAEVKKDIHLVLIIDACHSTSVTRTADFARMPQEIGSAAFNLANKRFEQPRTVKRSLESYLLSRDNYYTKLGGQVSIPRSKHLLFSACNSNGEAWETTDRRGLFTTKLIEVLEKNRNISYADLFAQVRIMVSNIANNQQPTFYPFEGFNPNTVFLGGEEKPNKKRHQIIVKENGEWVMDLGAINGVPTKMIDKPNILIGIYEGLGKHAIFKGSVGVSNVGITHLTLKDELNLFVDKNYWGELQTIPTIMFVNLKGRKKYIKDFLEKYSRQPSAYFEIVQKFNAANYTLNISKNGWKIKLTKTGEQIDFIQSSKKDSIAELKKLLEHIAHWENVATLENKSTTISDSIEVKFLEEKSRDNFITYTDSDIILDYYKAGEDMSRNGKPKPIWYQIKVRNISDENLYISLLHLSTNFEISSHFPTGVIPANSGWKTLDDQHGLVIVKKEDVQVKDLFKIVVSTHPFGNYKYIQKALNTNTRFSSSILSRKGYQDNWYNVSRQNYEERPKRYSPTVPREEYEEIPQDWFTRTISVTTIRPQGNIGKQALNINGITFEKHADFEAELFFSAIQGTSKRSYSINNLVDFFEENEATIINFRKASATGIQQDRSIIELLDIKNLESLAKNSLTIKVDAALSEGGNIIPITMKDGFIIPIGQSIVLADGSTQISINQFPKGTDLPSGAQGKRSLGKAFWFSLLKLANLKEEAFLLRKVSYKKSIASRVPLHKTSINRAKNILLVIHGIIGDTKTMITNLEFLKKEGHYDLILTYDYENLNTKIEDIAANLDEQLKAYGLGPNDGKTFDILAHSMGGLVSRYLIEFVRKRDTLVDHLFMFGTPNGGSIFGEIPVYRDKLVKLLTIGLNFGKAWLSEVGTTLGVLNKVLIGGANHLSVTLNQMNANSEFINRLKDGKKGHTKYKVIAGDISDYQNIKDARFKRFVESILLKVGKAATSNAPNDIAVQVEDIHLTPNAIAAEKYDICCHHMNYFDSEEGLLCLRDIVENRWEKYDEPQDLNFQGDKKTRTEPKFTSKHRNSSQYLEDDNNVFYEENGNWRIIFQGRKIYPKLSSRQGMEAIEILLSYPDNHFEPLDLYETLKNKYKSNEPSGRVEPQIIKQKKRDAEEMLLEFKRVESDIEKQIPTERIKYWETRFALAKALLTYGKYKNYMHEWRVAKNGLENLKSLEKGNSDLHNSIYEEYKNTDSTKNRKDSIRIAIKKVLESIKEVDELFHEYLTETIIIKNRVGVVPFMFKPSSSTNPKFKNISWHTKK